jgi:hypothetical protein
MRHPALLLVAALVAACSDNPAAPIPGGGDPENISSVSVTLTPVAGGTTLRATREDPDGTQLPGAPGPASAVLALRQGVTYAGAIEILNDLDAANIVDVIEEVEAESAFHRMAYTLSCAGVSVPVSSFNRDSQSPPQPLGTTFQLVVAADAPATSSCTLTVELRHFETDKGDGTGSNFETDLDLDFPVSIAP